MDKKEKLELLKEAFDDIVWMAIRYAHGRHTYASGIVRDACKIRAELGDFCLEKDMVIERAPTYESERRKRPGAIFKTDYLNDLFELYRDDEDE